MLTGWGMTAPTAATVKPLSTETSLHKSRRGTIARGLGRGYGDSAQNAGGIVLDSTANDSLLELDDVTGIVTVSGGVSLDRLLREAVPRGFFVPVTPGTRFVTIGGAIAADVHGKNHHRDGSFASHVENVTLSTPTGVQVIGPDDDLFWATAGGMGLTGAILQASVRLPRIPSASLRVNTDRTADLDGILAMMEEGDHRFHYSVAWIDCLARGRHLGRSVLTRGDFCEDDEAKEYNPKVRLHAPPVFPNGIVNSLTMRAFNEVWYRRFPRHRVGEIQSIPQFFHPLDGVGGWNRMWGSRGFLQYQFVVPFGAEDTLRLAVERLAEAGAGSPLAVLKRFGPGDAGHLSFPAPGWTLALDLAVTPELGPLLDGLDDAVVAAGGRVYLAKDSRTRPGLIPVMYPRLTEWREVRNKVDPDGALTSDLNRRLRLTGKP
jgi:decaprenylphospho-beta-D-ribofuranose 2-oxidase